MKRFAASVALLFAIALLPSVSHAQAGWLDGWSFRAPITVNNTAGPALSNFQVKVTLNGSFNFANAQTSGSDIRLTLSDGTTLIPFWIESWNAASTSASIWVRLPSLPPDGTTIYLYYGNAGASSVSSGDSTFEFFDDFENSSTVQSYFQLGSAQITLVTDQAWETTAPHTLSVVQANMGGHTYWGYYSLQDDCGGVGLAYSEDLVTWTKHIGNPLFTNGRWPSVIKVGSTFYMAYTENYCGMTPRINLATSTDGLSFTTVKTLVTANYLSNSRNQNPNLYLNPNDGQFYLYWYSGNDSNVFNIMARSAGSPEELDSIATEANLLTSTSTLAAPNMLYYNGIYYLSTETRRNGMWAVEMFTSTSPNSGFTPALANPVLPNDSACMFQHIFNNTLHNYYCQLGNTESSWTVEHRSADLSTAGALPSVDPAKWTASGGNWQIVSGTQQDGSTGFVAQGSTSNIQLLNSTYSGTDYVLEAFGKQVQDRVWGLGFRVNDSINFYSLNLYEDLDAGQNLWMYQWASSSIPLGSAAVGTVNLNAWMKLTVKASGGGFDVYTNDTFRFHASDALHPAGRIALYGENGGIAHFDNVLVRKVAAADPTTILGGEESSGAQLSALSMSPTSLIGGSSSTGTVTLSIPAPAGGLTVNLSDDSSFADTPASVTVTAGQTSATFDVTTLEVSSITTVTITATKDAVTRTATLTINPPSLLSVSLNPSSLAGGNSTTGTATLNGPAPAGGALVVLSDNSASATTPANVLVPEGATGTTFNITTIAVTSVTSVNVTGTYNTVQNATLTITPAALVSVSMSPDTLVGGNTSTGTVTLTSPAPVGGAAVALSSNNAAATVPLSVVVAEGTISANFQVSTTAVGANTAATITGDFNGIQSDILNITAPALSSVSVNPASVTGGNPSTGTVTLSGPAPAGGAIVMLLSDNVAATVPVSVTVAEGVTTADFPVGTIVVEVSNFANISATFNGTLATVLTIHPPAVSSVTLDPASVVGGSPSTGTVTLNAPAPPSGAVVTLSSDNAVVPGTEGVTNPNRLPPGGSINWADLGPAGTEIPSGTMVPVAGLPGVTMTVSTDNSLPLMTGTQCPGDECWSGNFAPGASILSTGGSFVGENWVNNGPLTVTFNSPQSGLGFQIQPDDYDVPFAATLCAYNSLDTLLGCVPFNGMSTQNADGSAISVGLYHDPQQISKVVIQTDGPSNGLAISNMFVSTARRQMVPASVNVAPGATTATFPISTSSVDTATTVNIAATYTATGSAPLLINPPAVASVSLNPASVAGGSPSTGTVTLSGPAPVGGALVTLSSNNAAATVPVSVTVGAGSTSANFQISTIAVGGNTSANISATHNGTQFGVLNIDAAGLISISLSPASVTGGSPSTGTVTLSSPAPASGAVVALSSDNVAATVPASVTVDAGNTTATFPLATTPVSTPTSATVTGVYNGSRNAILAIDSPALLTLVLNPASVTGGSPSIGTVTLNGPAPASGAVVMLLNDNAAASIPVSVTVPANLTTADFPITTSVVSISTLANISATYNATLAASLAINSPELLSMSLNPATVDGGNPSTGTATLTGPAPAGGVVVMLSSDNPIIAGVEGVFSPAGLPQDGSVDWANLGPVYSSVPSGTVTPVAGLPGLNMTLSTANGLPLQILTNCASGEECDWWGNFAPGATILWVGATYDEFTGGFTANGPLTVTFDSPQRGLGFQIMADESGPFTANLCAYNAADTLLGCVPFSGNGTGSADNSAVFVGFYDDEQVISKVTIDSGGALFPHDFAIGQMFVANTRRQIVPASVTVAAGATSASFPVSTYAVSTTTAVNIAGSFHGTRTAPLTINPPVLSAVSVSPAGVVGGDFSMGTATLTGTAPVGGVIVSLSANNPVSVEIQKVTSAAGMPQDGSVDWANVGPVYSWIPSGTVAPVTGLPGLNMTFSTANGLPSQIIPNCTPGSDCEWIGNFPPGAIVLWVGGEMDELTGGWVGNGPMTVTLDSPQRGLGFQIMADEYGPFTADLCAYDAADALLGCAPFSGNGDGVPNGSAIYVGLYHDAQQISKVTIDAGGALYPHDFAIGKVFVANTRRMVPPSVKVQAGSRTANFRLNTDTVTAVTTVTVTGGYQATHAANLIVTPPMPTDLSLSPATVTGGSPSTGTVTLNTPAPVGGTVVDLSSSNAAATVPASVTIDAGATTANFPVTTLAVAVPTAAIISASTGGTVETSQLTITPPELVSVSINPASVVGANPSTGTVTLSGPAPAGGALVNLLDDSASATTPASITVAAGATTATFNVTTVEVGTVTTVTVSATFSGITLTTSLTVDPPTLLSLAMSPTGVTGGSSSTGTVTLSSAAPVGGLLVTLSDNSASATTPAGVTVAAGATSATFNMSTFAVGASTTVTVSASRDGVTQTATVTIDPPVLLNLTMSPVSVIGGSPSTGTVTLSGPAPAGGALVTLLDDSASATTPDTVTVSSGATTATFTVTTSGVGAITVVTITGNFNGVRTATVTINHPVLSNLTVNPTSVTGGSPSTGTVALSGPAPAGGIDVLLSSNNAAANVPASVTVAGGATTANFPISTTIVSATATVTVTGILNGMRTADLIIDPPSLTSVSMNPTSVPGGVSSTGTVTLNGPAPSEGILVTLSDNNANATTPASVTVVAGATAATFTVTTIQVSATATVTVTAVSGGVTRTATLTVTPPALSSVSMSPSSVIGSNSSTGTVTLDSPALAGGAVVTLSDNSSSATTPGSVTVLAGATTATFNVTTSAVGTSTTVTITATRSGVTRTATLTLTPAQVASLTLLPTSVVGGLLNSVGTVTLNAPAAGTTTQRRVNLTSSNTAAATVPAFVTVTTGATTVTFTVTSVDVAATATSNITATKSGGSQVATITVLP